MLHVERLVFLKANEQSCSSDWVKPSWTWSVHLPWEIPKIQQTAAALTYDSGWLLYSPSPH